MESLVGILTDTSLGAGAGPDVMWQSSKAPGYVAGGALEPLDEYIAKAEMRVRVALGPLATTGYLQLFVKGSRAWTN